MSLIKQLIELNVSTVTETQVLESEQSFDEQIELFFNENRYYHFEGRKGIEALCALCAAIGYKDSNYNMQLSSKASLGDLMNFLEDNSGAIETLVEWIKDNANSDWGHNLSQELPQE